MSGALLQLISLTAYGNDYLTNLEFSSPFNQANTAFQFCATVDFRVFEKKPFSSKQREVVIANDTISWFKQLKENRCQRLRLYLEYTKPEHFLKDHKLASLVDGGKSWLIEAVYDDYSDYWSSQWNITKKGATDKNIWAVSYFKTSSSHQISNLQIDNDKVKKELEQTLIEITEFSLANKMENWANIFTKAKLTLNSPTPESSYHSKDLIPLENYALIAKQLIFSANAAWVFGGMGSWNDLGFDSSQKNQTYDRLTKELHENISTAIIAGINSY